MLNVRGFNFKFLDVEFLKSYRYSSFSVFILATFKLKLSRIQHCGRNTGLWHHITSSRLLNYLSSFHVFLRPSEPPCFSAIYLIFKKCQKLEMQGDGLTFFIFIKFVRTTVTFYIKCKMKGSLIIWPKKHLVEICYVSSFHDPVICNSINGHCLLFI